MYGLIPLLMSCKPAILSVDGPKEETEETCRNMSGNKACPLELIDQYGDTFSLYDHEGKVIILDFSAMWCAPCQNAAEEVQDVQDDYGDQIVYVTVLFNNSVGEDPSLSDVELWADVYDVEAPVLQGGEYLYDRTGNTGWDFSSIPAYHFIDQNMIVQDYMFGYNEYMLEERINNLL